MRCTGEDDVGAHPLGFLHDSDRLFDPSLTGYLKKGMEAKAKEFVEKGAEVYSQA